METKILSIDDPAALVVAMDILTGGGLVAFPTDTVYGLGALVFDERAVSKLYDVKERALEKAIPVLIGDSSQLARVAAGVNATCEKLAGRFWPGPLTIIAPASESVPLRVTGNTGRLAMRQSKSKVAHALIAKLNQPLIATSANISGQPTCTRGIEVFGTMDGRVDLILDAGPMVGHGATTVDITEPFWRIIREGAVAERDIADVLRGT